MIKLQQVSKIFFNIRALDNVSLTVEPRQVFGILGPNGAGKTTLLKVIAGFLQPDAGTLFMPDPFPRLGYKPEQLLYPNNLTVQDFLYMIAKLSDISAGQAEIVVRNLLAKVGLTHDAKKKIRQCSKGMKQRLGLAQALMGNPSILLLDEPSNGLDPDGQLEMRKLIQELKDAGKTILLSTHQLHEVTEVCTHLIILKKGKIHYSNTIENALKQLTNMVIELAQPPDPETERQLTLLHPKIYVHEREVILNGEANQVQGDALKVLIEKGYEILSLHKGQNSLADIYAEVMRQS